MRVMGVAAVIAAFIVLAVGAAMYWFEEIGDAAVIVGLIVLVFSLGISAAGWLSGERRTRVMHVVVVVVAFIVLAVGTAMYWFEQMWIAPVILGLIGLVFLLGISAGWLSSERRMRVMGVAAVIVAFIVLAVMAAIYWFELMWVAPVIVGLIVLVFLLGISAGWLSSERRMRVTGVVLLMVGLIVLTFVSTMYWFDEIDPRLCAESERIVTTEQAEAFGKQYIRNHENFWLGIEVSGKEGIEERVQRHCCVVRKGDHLANDPSRWRVSMSGVKGRYTFDYEVFFSECGKHVEVLKQVQEY